MDLAPILLSLSALFATGLAVDQIGRRTRLPRVTLLLGCGILAGRAGLDFIPSEVEAWYEILSIIALTMVAFLLGSSLSTGNLQAHGKVILLISISIVLTTILVVGFGLWLAGLELGLALLLGAVATATAPAATQDVIQQSGVNNSFTNSLKGIVAIDDVWGLTVFGMILVYAHQLNGSSENGILFSVVYELGGSVLLGVIIGLPAAFLTGRLTDGEPLQIEALALVFLTAGLSILLELSYLISGMTVGMIIVNRARHHRRAFHEIEHIQWPFMVLFFILAGASLEPAALVKVGGVGMLYVALRSLARIAGGWAGARMAKAPKSERPWYGIALLPQAGVAIGMALIAAKQFPDWADALLALTIGTTIAFEVIGPIATLYAINRVTNAK